LAAAARAKPQALILPNRANTRPPPLMLLPNSDFPKIALATGPDRDVLVLFQIT